jgi:hypothetical protein
MRLKSGFWVAAYLRRCATEGAYAVLRRRGAEEGGAIFIKLDRLDGTFQIYGPAPQTDYAESASERRFSRLHDAETIDAAEAEHRLARQVNFDPDLWIVEVEDRKGRTFL